MDIEKTCDDKKVCVCVRTTIHRTNNCRKCVVIRIRDVWRFDRMDRGSVDDFERRA